jgi:hypothetical protein
VLFLILFSLDSRYSGLYPSPVFQFLLPATVAAASVKSWFLAKFSNYKDENSNYLNDTISFFKENYLLTRSVIYLIFPILISILSLYLIKSASYHLSLQDYLFFAFISVSIGSFANFISDKNTTKHHVIIYLILSVAVIISQYILAFPAANQVIFRNAPLLFSWAIPFIGLLRKPHADN